MDMHHLSVILQVYPEDCQCIGFAPSKGRRCRMRTRADNRDRSRSLLTEGTKKLHEGNPVDDILTSLAPLLLCTRFHQNQAPKIVAGWKHETHAALRSIRRSLRLEASTTRATPRVPTYSGQLLSTAAPGHRHEREVEHTSSRSIRSSALLPRRTNASTHTPSATINTRIPFTSQSVGGERQSHTSPHGRSRDSEPSATARRQSVSSHPTTARRSITSMPRSAEAAADSPRRRQPMQPEVVARAPSCESSEVGVTRRAIEGDCGICLSPLRKRERVAGLSHNDVIEQTQLVWCKSQCGNNLHKQCFDEWREVAQRGSVTCPFCRSKWK